MLFTRKGDNGTSGLFDSKDRLPKDSPIYEVLGSLDELNSLLGVCRVKSKHKTKSTIPIADILYQAQQTLFIIQAQLAGADKSINGLEIAHLESSIYEIENILTPIHSFIIPGGTELSGMLDLARSVCRRAERRMISLANTSAISPETLTYLNRLSSLLYALARYTAPGHTQKPPKY